MKRASRQLGRPFTVLCLLAIGVGAVSFSLGLVWNERGPVFAAMGASWLLTAGVAAGAIALSAAVHVAQGRWATLLLMPAEGTAAFLVPAVLVVCLLVFGSHTWMPEADALGAGFVVRQLVVSFMLLAASQLYLRRRARGKPVGAAAIGYLFVYVAALSSWVVDFTSGTRHWAPSTVLPPFFFMSALLGALAWSTVVSMMKREQPLDEEARHDAGKLLFGFACFWMYLVFASYLPIWFENIPEETGFLFDRLRGAFRMPTLLMLLTTGVLPFALLLTEWAKRKRVVLGVACVSVLIGLTLECFLFVFPSLPYPIDWLGAVLCTGVGVGMLGLFALSAGWGLGRLSPQMDVVRAEGSAEVIP